MKLQHILPCWTLALCFGLGLGSGCKKAEAPPPEAAKKTATSTTGPLGVAGIQALPSKLASEAASRPTDTPRAEAVFDKFAKAGLLVRPSHQSLGATVHAVYCTATATPDDAITLSICEYATPAEAADGRAFALKAFSTVPDREILVNKKTTLLLRRVQKTDATAEMVKKMSELFLGLE